MLRFLFRGLTSEPARGQPLFDRVVAEVRKPHWYIEGEVADTIDGRFAVLATVCAMFIVRLERGDVPDEASVALTERFVEAMDAEHRQLGLNDPGLGRRVRKLVAALERRVDEWRAATAGEREWDETVEGSLYRSTGATDYALAHSGLALRKLWERLEQVQESSLVKGEL
jgi:cytochrome b pre-mRNA-processing protein 3